MKQEFKYSFGTKRYHTYDYYLKTKYGEKCAKIGLDGGFTCPNRDGTKGIGGCAFCAGNGVETSGKGTRSLKEQYEAGRDLLEKKWGRVKTIPYFQAYTSTYAHEEYLKTCYEQALHFEDAVGLCIATRPDALPENVLDYLEKLRERTDLSVELGLQTIFDETAEKMNRGHTFEEFLQGYEQLKKRGIAVGVHLINGLPGEDADMMRKSAEIIGALQPEFLKIHALYIRQGSALAEIYEKHPFPLLTMEEYIAVTADQLEVIPSETVIERLTGDPLRNALIAPLWTSDKKKVLAGIDKTLKKRDSFQGSRYLTGKIL